VRLRFLVGGEVVRQRLLRAPKYGNDLDEVDELAVRVMKDYQAEMVKYHHTRYGRGPIGGGYAGSTSNISANVPLGAKIGATPDGRKAGEPIAEGVSAMHGTDSSGPTGLLRSVSKLRLDLASNGALLNMKFLPAFFNSPAALDKFVLLLRGFCRLQIPHVQFNVVSAETLRRAQAQPEAYRSLVVRVAGYSAYFTELDHDLQNEIIARTAFGEA
jgi:formate C-acetyltransferase